MATTARMEDGAPARSRSEQTTVTINDARAILSWIGNGLRMEDATRLLYPEEAAKIYDPARWPHGTPKD